MQILSIAAGGLMNAQSRLEASARRAAQAPLDRLPAEAIERLEARIAFSANAAMIRAADAMTASLLDVLA